MRVCASTPSAVCCALPACLPNSSTPAGGIAVGLWRLICERKIRKANIASVIRIRADDCCWSEWRTLQHHTSSASISQPRAHTNASTSCDAPTFTRHKKASGTSFEGNTTHHGFWGYFPVVVHPSSFPVVQNSQPSSNRVGLYAATTVRARRTTGNGGSNPFKEQIFRLLASLARLFAIGPIARK